MVTANLAGTAATRLPINLASWLDSISWSVDGLSRRLAERETPPTAEEWQWIQWEYQVMTTIMHGLVLYLSRAMDTGPAPSTVGQSLSPADCGELTRQLKPITRAIEDLNERIKYWAFRLN